MEMVHQAPRWVRERLGGASPAAIAARALEASFANALDGTTADAVSGLTKLALAPALSSHARARVTAWSSAHVARITLSWLDLAPLAARLELVAIPRGARPTLLVRVDADPSGTFHLWFDAFAPGGEHAGARRAVAPLVERFHAAAHALRSGGARPSPRYSRALSSGGGLVTTRDRDALARELAPLLRDAIAFASSASEAAARPPAFDAAHRTIADALRAHDVLARAIRWRFGAAFAAHLDAARFADL